MSDFREYLGDSGKMYTDKELSNILMSREDALRAIPGRHTVTTPRRVELYGDGVLHGFLNLTKGRVGGTAIDNVKNITHVKGVPVSPELYAGGIYQSLDSGTLGLESG